MAQGAAWSTQQLAEFLAAVSCFETEAAAALGAVERAAEAVDAEVAAIVRDGHVIASVGYPADSVPIAELEAVARGVIDHLSIPGSGRCPACAVPLDHPAEGPLVVARSGPEGLDREEVSLLHGMARVTSMTMRLLRLLEDERSVRAELAASRLRVVAAADETRRRIERNLHDGIQQRLVTLAFKLRGIRAGLPDDLSELRAQLSHVEEGLTSSLEELREISRGLHPAILSQGGLGPALKSLVRRSALPVQLDVGVDERLPEPVEVAAYYVVSEALANTAKHAEAAAAQVDVHVSGRALRVHVCDDGRGGADPRGSGIIGLRDRVEAVGGSFTLTSPAGAGTSIVVELPIERS